MVALIGTWMAPSRVSVVAFLDGGLDSAASHLDGGERGRDAGTAADDRPVAAEGDEPDDDDDDSPSAADDDAWQLHASLRALPWPTRTRRPCQPSAEPATPPPRA